MKTVKDVQEVLDKIEASKFDDEAAHIYEDELWIQVLQAIADGTAKNPQEMAKLALTSSNIEFARWYA